ncbi:hypothetical protein ACFW6F_38710 [Streptomyces sp. NPDC058746]|uniref:hypothetical protein n=1 Tax=Streptomyces sp. NPDC058746 TaxID=3346622 RepID=UPI003690C60C
MSAEHGETAARMVALLSEDAAVASPVARRLRALLYDRLAEQGLAFLADFERTPSAPEAADRLTAALVNLVEADPAFAEEAGALLRGSLGSRADEVWATGSVGRPLSVLWFVIPLAVLWLVISAIAAFSGAPVDLP